MNLLLRIGGGFVAGTWRPIATRPDGSLKAVIGPSSFFSLFARFRQRIHAEIAS
jgi:hypothetical protein